MEVILIRHGKPVGAHNPKLRASGYLKWIRAYERSSLCETSRPAPRLNTLCAGAYVVSSSVLRARESALLVLGREAELEDALYKEMDIPWYPLPFHLKAWTWLYMSRLLWLVGFKGKFESTQQAKLRAKQACIQLEQLALKKGKVVLFGHGVMNLYLRKAFKAKGWKVEEKDNGYWGVSRLSLN